MKEKVLKSLEETENFAKEIFQMLEAKKPENGAMILSLYGNLGAGKTTFSQMLGRLLGVKEAMQSPTFLIQKSYETKNKIFKKLIHIDAYRIEDSEEMLVLGFEDLVKENDTLVVIEWPERIEKIIPENVFKIYFEFVDENTRKVKI